MSAHLSFSSWLERMEWEQGSNYKSVVNEGGRKGCKMDHWWKWVNLLILRFVKDTSRVDGLISHFEIYVNGMAYVWKLWIQMYMFTK